MEFAFFVIIHWSALDVICLNKFVNVFVRPFQYGQKHTHPLVFVFVVYSAYLRLLIAVRARTAFAPSYAMNGNIANLVFLQLRATKSRKSRGQSLLLHKLKKGLFRSDNLSTVFGGMGYCSRWVDRCRFIYHSHLDARKL